MANALQVISTEMVALPQLVSVPPSPRKRLNSARVYRIVAAASLFMCALVVLIMHKQDRTIQTQRQLIRELYRDSVELNSIKMRAVEKQHQAKPQAQQKHSRHLHRQASRVHVLSDGCIRGICG